MATGGSAVVFWHDVKVPADAPLPWTQVGTIALADLKPLNGQAVVEEQMVCLGTFNGRKFPCVALYIEEDEDVDDLRKNYLTLEMEMRYAKMGQRWLRKHGKPTMAAFGNKPVAQSVSPKISFGKVSGFVTPPWSVKSILCNKFNSRDRAKSVTFNQTVETAQSFRNVRRNRSVEQPVNGDPEESDRESSPEIAPPPGHALGRGSASAARRSSPGPMRLVLRVPNPARLRSVFHTVFKESVTTWGVINGVKIAQLQSKVDECSSWRKGFILALHTLFAYKELTSAGVRTIDQQRLKVAIGLAVEYCQMKGMTRPSLYMFLKAFSHAKFTKKPDEVK